MRLLKTQTYNIDTLVTLINEVLRLNDFQDVPIDQGLFIELRNGIPKYVGYKDDFKEPGVIFIDRNSQRQIFFKARQILVGELNKFFYFQHEFKELFNVELKKNEISRNNKLLLEVVEDRLIKLEPQPTYIEEGIHELVKDFYNKLLTDIPELKTNFITFNADTYFLTVNVYENLASYRFRKYMSILKEDEKECYKLHTQI